MDAKNFLVMLFDFAVISGLVTQGIKNLFKDKNLPWNVVAMAVAIVVGVIGTALYDRFNGIAFDMDNIICMVLMGFASGLASMVGFDKVKQAVLQLTGSKE